MLAHLRGKPGLDCLCQLAVPFVGWVACVCAARGDPVAIDVSVIRRVAGCAPDNLSVPVVVLRVTIISYVSINSGGALYRYQEDTDGVLRPLYWGEVAPHKCSSRVTKETRVVTGNVSKLALKQRKEVNRFRKPARLGQRPHACRAVAWEQRVDDCLVHSVPVKECNASSILRTSAQKGGGSLLPTREDTSGCVVGEGTKLSRRTVRFGRVAAAPSSRWLVL